MPLNSNFQIGDHVDCLEEVFIWWPAIIKGFTSEWCASVVWVGYEHKGHSLIEVPIAQRHDPAMWNVRLPERSQLPDKRNRNKEHLTDYQPRFQSRNDQVFSKSFFNIIFWGKYFFKQKHGVSTLWG